MAIEPKKLIQENIPLVACYGAALVAVVVWAVVVRPLAAQELPKKTRSLKNVTTKLNKLKTLVDENKLLTQDDEDKAVDRRKALEAQIKSLARLYIDEDQKLEQWFPELKLKAMHDKDGGHPPAGQFTERYKSKFDKLINKHKAMVQPVAEEKPRLVYEDRAQSPQDRIRSQKEFWYKEDILDTFAKSGVTELLSDIRATPISPPVNDKSSNDDEEGGGSTDPLYTETEFTTSVKIRFSDLSSLVRNLLAAKFTYKIKKVSVRRTEFAYKVDTPGKLAINDLAKAKHFSSPTYTVTFPESVTEFSNSESELVPEPPVIVDVVIRALDFNVKPVKEDSEEEEE